MQSISLENNNVSKASGSRQILNVSVPSFPLPVLRAWPSEKSNHFAVRLLFLSLSLCARYWSQRSSLDSGTCMKHMALLMVLSTIIYLSIQVLVKLDIKCSWCSHDHLLNSGPCENMQLLINIPDDMSLNNIHLCLVWIVQIWYLRCDTQCRCRCPEDLMPVLFFFFGWIFCA
jgi:hypothetical protein